MGKKAGKQQCTNEVNQSMTMGIKKRRLVVSQAPLPVQDEPVQTPAKLDKT